MRKVIARILLGILLITTQGCAIDKVRHFGSCLTISYISMSLYKDKIDNPGAMAFFTGVSVGAIKEWLDKTFDWGDFLADIVGSGTGALLGDKI